MRLSPTVTRRLLLLLILILWEAVAKLGLVSSLFLPSLSDALAAAYHDRAIYLANLLVTLGEVAIAMIICCGGGIVLGALIGSIAALRRPLTTLFSSFYAVPLVILYPLMAAWLGIGPGSKIAFASLYGIVPAVLASAAGIQSIDRQLSLTARSMGATLAQRIVHVIIPAAIPSILSAIRIGGSLAIVGVVVAEMLTSAAGLGFLITSYRTVLDSSRVFAAILFVLVIAIAFNSLVRWLERRTERWSASIGRK
jgi:NitT/TauT family transport system permease protein/taurine transport system permease protein